MPLLGNAAVAMWWDIAAEWRQEFEDWHSHEHFPERMSIPGFRRGTRWASADGGEGFFVMYELDRYETLISEGYLSRLNRPTPWSTKLMPHHRRMVRSQCRVMDSRGGAIARHALTVRLSAQPGRDKELRGYLGELSARIAGGPGFVAAHLLRTETPAIAATTEQAIRGGRDATADWIYVAVGYEEAALRALRDNELAAALVERGAVEGPTVGLYVLSCTATPADFA